MEEEVNKILRKHLYNNGCRFIDIPSNRMEKAIKDAIREALKSSAHKPEVYQQKELSDTISTQENKKAP